MDPHSLAFLRIPFDVLTALDSRNFHYALQPYHYLVRIAHILAAAAFFGGIGLFDLRLMGARSGLPVRALADHAMPWLYTAFGVILVSGVALFLYDPVQVGSHAYFTPKLALILLGLANAVLFHRIGYRPALAAEGRLPAAGRLAGAVSLAFWMGVMVCACLDTEAAPKVLLR